VSGVRKKNYWSDGVLGWWKKGLEWWSDGVVGERIGVVEGDTEVSGFGFH